MKNAKSYLILLLLLAFSAQLTAQQDTNDTTILVRGIYNNHEEFLTNKPGITEPFYLKQIERLQKAWKGTYKIKIKYTESNKRAKPNSHWGFCDGTKTYIEHQGEYFEIEEENGEYFFVGYDLLNLNPSATAAAGVAGGLVGGALYAGIATSVARSKRIRYTIEMQNGTAIHPYKGKDKRTENYNNVLIIYRTSKKQNETPMEFIIDDSLDFSFVPDSYAKILYDTCVHSVRVCYGENLADCVDFELINAKSVYLQCNFGKKSPKPEIVEVDYEYGKFYAEKPRKITEKRLEEQLEKEMDEE